MTRHLPQTPAPQPAPRDAGASPPSARRGVPIIPAALLVLTAAAVPIVMDAAAYVAEVKRCAERPACVEGMVR